MILRTSIPGDIVRHINSFIPISCDKKIWELNQCWYCLQLGNCFCKEFIVQESVIRRHDPSKSTYRRLRELTSHLPYHKIKKHRGSRYKQAYINALRDQIIDTRRFHMIHFWWICPRLCNVISQGVVPPLSLLKLPSQWTNHTKASRPRLLYNILLVNY